MLYCKIKFINKENKEIFKEAAKKMTKLYQSGGSIPRNGSVIKGFKIIGRKSDLNSINLILEK